jgi:hypothetical protein
MKRSTLVYGIVAVAAVSLGAFYLTRNRPPEPKDDRASVAEAESVDIDVLANDSDPDRDPLKILSVKAPGHGTAVISTDRKRIKYTPAVGFYGQDGFKYRVSDPSGADAEASVQVEVQFVPPNFHRRSTSATLSEMLQEPPTNIYGSTINVFLYRNEAGNLREITIAGHADSLTCRETSGAFAGALIDAGGTRENFLIAGAGRMAIPDADRDRAAALAGNEDAAKYISLKAQADLIRLLVSRGLLSAAAAEERLGMTLAAAQASIDDLSKKAAVVEYLTLVRAGESAETFARAAGELQESTGMLRLHNVPFDRIQPVRDRLRTAAMAGKSEAVQFADLLPASTDEAVVYVPVLKLGSGTELTFSVPLGEFSPEAFRRAAKIHRSALENSIVGSAEKRLAHAERFLKGAQEQQRECAGMSSAQLAAPVRGKMQSCDRDTCVDDPNAPRLTNQQYCSTNVPANLRAGKSWKEEAERVLARVRQFRERQDDNQIDTLTHAVLVDSMLRDWALPFPNAQAAFDYWRKQGRGTAWKSLTDAMTAAGVGRAALSGESVVFDVSLAGDTLSIRPLMAIDLKRTTVLIDQALGATAALSAWELRRSESEAPTESGKGNAMERLVANPREWARSVQAAPEASISELLDALVAQLPAEDASWRAQVANAERAYALQIEEELGRGLEGALTQPASSQEEAWKRLLELNYAGYAARNLPGMSTAFRLRAATAVAQSMLAFKAATNRDGWRYIKGVFTQAPAASQIATDRVDQLFFGEPADNYLRAIVKRAQADDPTAFNASFAAQVSPKQTEAAGNLTAQPVLTHVVGLVERARSALILRAKLDQLLGAFGEDGSAPIDTLNRIMQATAFNTVWYGSSWNELSLTIRFLAAQSNSQRINPIEGSKIVSEISALKTRLDNELRGMEPAMATIRLGRDQEVIVARLLFDKGAYAAAFDRLAPKTVPLALYVPAIKWSPVDPQIRGIPEKLSFRLQGQQIIVTASLRGVAKDVLRLEGIEGSARQLLLASQPIPPTAWTEGDPLWQQILLAQVPSPEPLTSARKALSDDAVRLSALKAMVYACAVPGRHLLDREGRCKSADGSTVLHDRVGVGNGTRFVTPDRQESLARARDRFLTGIAWRPDFSAAAK